MNRIPIAININFDSLNQAYGFPEGFRDPSFFEGMDRFLEISNRYKAPLTIFVIGQDLQNPEIYARVRDWSNAGYEIGNHSWSHPVNLGSLSPETIRDEIFRTHEIITKCTGKEPTGFISPAWSTSKALINALIDLNYLYDTSAFPSLLMYPAIIKNFFNVLFKKPHKAWEILNRSDWLGPIISPTQPFLSRRKCQGLESNEEESILVLPLPTLNRIMPCIWHTIGFILGWKFVKNQLGGLLHSQKSFYYLLHPADFLGIEDQDKRYQHTLYRMEEPLHKKLKYLEVIFSQLSKSNRPIVTMHELACYYYEKARIHPTEVCYQK